MIVHSVWGDAGKEWAEGYEVGADNFDIPESLWKAYEAAQDVFLALNDAIAIVGNEVDASEADLVTDADHLVTHHGMTPHDRHHRDLAIMVSRHSDMKPTIPHVHHG